MNKKLAKLGAASLLAVGAGTMLMKKGGMKSRNPETKAQREKELKRIPQHRAAGRQAEKQQGHLLFQRQLRSVCPPGEARGRG